MLQIKRDTTTQELLDSSMDDLFHYYCLCRPRMTFCGMVIKKHSPGNGSEPKCRVCVEQEAICCPYCRFPLNLIETAQKKLNGE